MLRFRGRPLAFAAASAALLACTVDTAPRGLRATPPGTGPRVVFDLAKRPLPDIPAPNDIATFADPTSRTGLRVNASMVAPTNMERRARAEFDEMEGWGTFAPIFVSFQRGDGADPTEPALDLDRIRGRMQDSRYDLSDDPVYVVNLATGVPVLLDMGQGSFPAAVSDPSSYWANDPHADAAHGRVSQNLVFEDLEEGVGLTQADYRPELDLDFDGVLDHPNTLGPALTPTSRIDNLLTWYERETDSLIMRPILPMEEKQRYAVVLTDRLTGPGGKPVRSPFASIHHPLQRSGVERLRDILADKSFAEYYGDLAGTGLDHVAFAWTFTTQPTYEDMRLLRDGLYGHGPFARWKDEFAPKVDVFRAVGKSTDESAEPPNWQALPECAKVASRPFIVRLGEAKSTIHDFLVDILKLREDETSLLLDSLANVDHVVIGTYDVPYLLGDPASVDPYAHFKVNFKTGEADVHRDKVHFWLAVPKAQKGFKQPFATTFWRHGTAQSDLESLLHIGHMARQGVATFGIDAPGHGQYFDPGQKLLASAFLSQSCLTPWITALAAGRAIDLDADGVPDSGGLLWSSHILHSRDNIRQANLEALQGTRVLRAFDGAALGDDYDLDGKPDLAGDFDVDGTPDVGGPNVPYFTAGDSFGGIMAQIQAATDPYVVAAAPISGGGGLIDVAVRSSLVPDSVLEQIFSPLVVAVPAESRPPDSSGPNTACAAGERSVRWVVNSLIASKEIEIACAPAADLDAKMTVVVTNVATRVRSCARTGDGGTFRVPIAASVGDRIDVQIYTRPDVVDSYATCNVDESTAPIGRRIQTWEKAALKFGSVADGSKTCGSDAGCQQYRDVFYEVGSPLVAPQEGIGYRRQTPDFRKLMNLVQAAVDPADPVNFAAYYMLRPIPGIDGAPVGPHALLDVHVIGDPYVPVGQGNTFARAAGAIPFLPPSSAERYPEYAAFAAPQDLVTAYGGRTPNQVLVDAHVLEGQPRFQRTPADATCSVNYAATATCSAPPAVDSSTCRQSLADVDWVAEGAQGFGQQHERVALRLARQATIAGEPTASWQPRIKTLQASDDAAGWPPSTPLVATLNAYMTPLGQHVWFIGDPCKRWDDVTYMENLIARFIGSSGKDLYYASHPATHACLASRTCPFFN